MPSEMNDPLESKRQSGKMEFTVFLYPNLWIDTLILHSIARSKSLGLANIYTKA